MFFGTNLLSEIFKIDIALLMALGTFIGLAFGAIPGMTGSMAISMLLPLTFHLNPFQSIALLIGVYKASMFAGAISAITFGMPGTPAAALDVLDGVPLREQGDANKAIQISLYASVLADVSSDVVLLYTAAPIAAFAIAFGTREMFGLLLLAFMMCIIFAQKNPVKGIIASALGVTLAMIGTDEFYVHPRFAFGILHLQDGLELVPFVVGLFAFSEIFTRLIKILKDKYSKIVVEKFTLFSLKDKGGKNLTLKELLRCWREIFIGTVAGTIMGALPGLGSAVGSFTSYAISKRVSRNAEQFGKGALEGLAAAESGDSATVGATFIPLFAFGIPGSAIAALFGVAFMAQGLTPGPALFKEHPDIMYALLYLIIYANLFHLVLGRMLIPFFAKLAYVSSDVLVPILTFFAVVGIYAYRGNPVDVVVMVLAGIIGYFLVLHEFPLPSVIIGFILGPMLEKYFRRGLLIGQGDITFFFKSPIFNWLLLLTFLVCFFFYFMKPKKNKTTL